MNIEESYMQLYVHIYTKYTYYPCIVKTGKNVKCFVAWSVIIKTFVVANKIPVQAWLLDFTFYNRPIFLGHSFFTLRVFCNIWSEKTTKIMHLQKQVDATCFFVAIA